MARRIRILTANAEFQFVETLRRNRSKRHRHGAVFVEGVRNINALLTSGWPVLGLYYASGVRLSDWARDVLERAGAETHYEPAPDLMAQLSRKHEASELLAVAAMPPDDLERIPLDLGALVVLVDRSSSPGNLGTLLRSCDALGASGVLLSGHGVDLYDPEVIAASAGSLFAVPAVRLESPDELLVWLAGARAALPGFQVVGSSAGGRVPVFAHDFTRPTLLLVGNERRGLSRHYLELCDTLVTIPMAAGSGASSLNVACAATVMLYEAARQRR